MRILGAYTGTTYLIHTVWNSGKVRLSLLEDGRILEKNEDNFPCICLVNPLNIENSLGYLKMM